jgi:hypothetical protein
MNRPPDTSAPRAPEPALEALPTRWSRSWAVIVLASTVAVGLVSLIGGLEIVRAPITVWFIAICPGMAIVRLLRLDEPIADVMLALALSFALAGLIPAIFLYLGAWSPAWSLTTLVAIAATGLALDPVIVPRHGWTSPGRAIRGRILLFSGRADPAMGQARPLTPPRRSGQPSLASRAMPPIAIVTRLPPQATPMSADARSRIRGRTLGSDPLAEDEASVALRSAFDRVIGDIADRRQQDD